jgi:hypothetical protein
MLLAAVASTLGRAIPRERIGEKMEAGRARGVRLPALVLTVILASIDAVSADGREGTGFVL